MIQIDRDLCTGCGKCQADCITHAIAVKDGKACAGLGCFKCGHCVAVCPQGAVSLPCYPPECVEYEAATFGVPTENLLNHIKFRRSIRNFKSQQISMEHLRLMLDAAGHAPTAKNTQGNRFVFIQDSLDQFKEIVWRGLREALAAYKENPSYDAAASLVIPHDRLERMIAEHDGSEGVDFLFRNAPAVLFVESTDPLDAGLAASAIELVGATLGIGALYDGYLRRVFLSNPEAQAFCDSSAEKPACACMLLGYSNVKYVRTAPRRIPSICLR